MLDLPGQSGLQVNPDGFRPGSDLYAVDVVRPIENESAFVETVTFDPAEPTTTMRYDSTPPAGGPDILEVPALHARAHLDVIDGRPVSADIVGARGESFSCAGRQATARPAGRRLLFAPGRRRHSQEGVLRRRNDQRAELVRKSLIRSASSAGCSTTIACEASASEM
jgi:hypothetical protein